MEGISDIKGKLYICISKLMSNPVEFEWDDIIECKRFMDETDSRSKELSRILHKAANIASIMINAVRSGDLESHYISLFELSPKCPPYLGYYGFKEEQKRRMFMVEIAGYYKRFGLKMKRGELPDYVPAVAEFLGLTVYSGLKARRVFVYKYVKPYIGSLIECLKKHSSLYHELYSVFDSLLDFEFARQILVER
ncbi:MAG: nitrate reductase molybdenum cofactor assembly chaperone [Desulfurococcales archaeon]|nr:nitrate reductase molybdenum cofactor assembly chaperone [Desulfurococcales archaeon]